ncbi:MAG: acetylglutamate kinase [Ruminococcaceae bacterium]|nr:acetylglutamate kinase [Oscillospiraceae bacterium]
MEMTNAHRAEVLTQALPYIQKYYGKSVVVKYGGNAMINEHLKEQVMEDIVLLHLIGVKVVLVHGGGPEITDMLKRIGKESVFHNGLRVTDKETAEVVQMVLAGKINKSLVNLLEIKGGDAIGLSGLDGHMIQAEMKDEALGFVGKITNVDVTPITDILEKGYIPVVSTIGCDNEGNIYNINADTAAAYIAGEMKAERLLTMTDIAGILRDKDDPSSIIPCVDIAEARELFDSGVISGGMIPKVECCIEAIEHGVERVTILDGRVPHALLIEMLTEEGAGTMVIADKNCSQ